MVWIIFYIHFLPLSNCIVRFSSKLCYFNFGQHLMVISIVLAISWQIQFPALDIRLSYNDIQLFLAIAKSIPTASASLPCDSDTTSSTSTEPPAAPKDNFKQKAEVLIGTYKLAHHHLFLGWIVGKRVKEMCWYWHCKNIQRRGVTVQKSHGLYIVHRIVYHNNLLFAKW